MYRSRRPVLLSTADNGLAPGITAAGRSRVERSESALVAAQTAEQKTSRYYDSIRNHPTLLLGFLHGMPKGGDLHNHLSGALYAEDMIDWAAADNFCVDRTTSRLIAPPCDTCEHYTPNPAIRCAYGDHILYNQIIDAWSMRNWHREEESGHDHFFGTFEKFDPAFDHHYGNAFDTPQWRGLATLSAGDVLRNGR